MHSKDFHPETALNEYIIQVKERAALTPSDEQELRTHLMDASEDLLKCGLNAEEAFIISVKRMGNAEQVGSEYRKVNAGFVTDKIWAYMLLGFSLITSAIWLYTTVSGNLSLYLIRHFMQEPARIHAIIIVFNLVVCAIIWSVLYWGNLFSAWVQHIIQSRPWFIASLLTAGVAIVIFIEPFVRSVNKEILHPQYYLRDYRSILNSNFVELSFYLILISAAMVVLLSVFTISNAGRLSLKSIFERPSYIFLLLFGFAVEMIAAMSRVTGVHNLIIGALLFAIIYAVAAFAVSYYNNSKVSVYLLVFALFGLVAETWSGILADISRGGTFYTAYYVPALIIGVLAGWGTGIKARRRAVFI
jgi:hypothetical protein